MIPSDLIGKTITKAEYMRKLDYDDKGWLKLTFSDGSYCVIVAGFDMYTGNSIDEYPTYISITDEIDGLEAID